MQICTKDEILCLTKSQAGCAFAFQRKFSGHGHPTSSHRSLCCLCGADNLQAPISNLHMCFQMFCHICRRYTSEAFCGPLTPVPKAVSRPRFVKTKSRPVISLSWVIRQCCIKHILPDWYVHLCCKERHCIR